MKPSEKTTKTELENRIQELEKEVERLKNDELNFGSIKERGDLYSLIFEHGPDAVFISDFRGDYVMINQKACDMLGYSREELLSMNIMDLAEDANRADHKALFDSLLVSNSLFSEITLKCKNGKLLPVELNAILLPGRKVYGSCRDISEKKIFEKQFFEYKNLMSKSQELGKIGSWEYDLVSNTLTWTDEVYRIFGMKAQEKPVDYDFFLTCVHPEDKKNVDQVYKHSVLNRLDKYELEHRIFRRDNGELRFLKEKCIHIKNQQGEILKSVGFVQDLTEKVLNEETYANIIKSLNNGLWIVDADRKILEVNDAAAKMLGYSKEEMIGKTINDFDVLENPEVSRQHIEEIKEKGSVLFESRHRCKSGEIIDVELSVRYLYLRKNTLMAFIRNITEKKHAEAELRKSESKFKSIFDESPIGIVSYSKEGFITSCNKRFVEIIGSSKEQLLGLNLFLLKDKKLVQAVKESFRTGKAEYEDVYRPETADKMTYVRIVFKCVYNESNEPDAGIGIVEDISERKHIETELRTKEERYRAFLKALPDILFRIDKNLMFLDCHCSNEKELLLPYDQIVGSKAEDILPPDLFQLTKEKLLLALETGETINYEYSVVVNGEKEWEDTRMVPINKEEALVIIRNISKRKKAEKEVAMLQQAVNQSPVSVVITNTKGDIEYVNDEFFKLTGYKSEEVIGKNPRLLNAGKLPAEHYQRLWKTISEGNIWEGELYNKKANGELYWEQALISPVKDECGAITNFIAVKEDITEKKLLWDELLQAKENAEANERQFRNLFENMEQGFALHKMIYDKHGKPTDYEYVLINQAFQKLTGNKASDIIGKRVKEVLPDTEMVWIENFGKVALTGQALHFENYSKEFDKHYDVVAYSPKKHYFAVIFTDVTENKKHHYELIMAKEKAEEGDRLKTAFLTNMSHEIRTPMNGIMGFSEMLKSPGITDEKLKFYSDIILKNGKELLVLVDDIIDIAKIESGSIELKDEEFSLNNLMNDLYANYKLKARELALGFEVHKGLSDKESTIRSDEKRLTQILDNLLKNAFKFTRTGSIKFGYRLDNKRIELFVQDSGIGIAKKDHEKVFDRFWQAETGLSRQYGGAGIGLSISKKMTELLGGDIWLESELGVGSTFKFSLPYKPAFDVETLKLKGNGETFTLLVAEDEETNFIFIEEALSSENIVILRARNGEETVRMCKENEHINMVLMDIKMPVLNGYEATMKIKTIRPGLPIVAQTAYAMSEDRIRAEQSGCDAYLAKPISPTDLINCVRTYKNKQSS